MMGTSVGTGGGAFLISWETFSVSGFSHSLPGISPVESPCGLQWVGESLGSRDSRSTCMPHHGAQSYWDPPVPPHFLTHLPPLHPSVSTIRSSPKWCPEYENFVYHGCLTNSSPSLLSPGLGSLLTVWSTSFLVILHTVSRVSSLKFN